MTRLRRLTALVATVILVAATPALAQVDHPRPFPPPCGVFDGCILPPQPDGRVVIERYRVDTVIEDQIAVTRVTQVLRNDGHGQAEGVFLHPLPAGAAVTELVLWIDGEPVTGDVLNAGDARGTYEDIVRRLRDPALLEFADQGLVRLRVFPIPEGKERRVELEYVEVLGADSGLVRYVHPMGRETASLGGVESASASIEIRSSNADVKNVFSPTHDVDVDRRTARRVVVSWESGRDAVDTDFAVHWSTSTDTIGAGVLSFRDAGEDGFFALLVAPGLLDEDAIAVPKDVILVIDRSGSMEGAKFAQAQDAARFVLERLNPDDRFSVISFATGLDSFATRLRPASEARLAIDWVDRLGAGGGTDIHAALTEAFDHADDEHPAYVIFLTDGLPTEGIVHSGGIVERLTDAAPDTVSLFAFGVGYDVDTILLDTLAQGHRGTTTYVTPGEDIDTAVSILYGKVASPVLTDVRLVMDGVGAGDIYPLPLPDLFAGEQLVVVGRYRDPGAGTVTLTGMVGRDERTFRFDDLAFVRDGGTETLPRLWATRKIGHLLREVRIDGPTDEAIDQIVRLSIRFGVVTPYTSYLVTEPAPFGEVELERIVDDAFEAAATTTAPTAGRDAVNQSATAGSLADSDHAAAPGEHGDRVQFAGSRTFLLTDGVWVDTTYDPDLVPLAVPFLSDAYFALAGDPDIATALGLGDQLIVMADGIAYGIVAEGEPGDPFTPPTTVATSVPTTIATGPGTTVPTVTPTTTREIPGITERPPPITTPATTAVATAIIVAGTADGSSPTSLPIVLAVVLGLIGVVAALAIVGRD